MKHFKFTFLTLLLFGLLASCSEDEGTVNVTYQEATAIYGNLDEIRTTELNQPVQDFSNPGKIYVGENFILIGEEEKGIHVINNSDNSTPYQESFISIPGNREYVVFGNTLYAESYYDMLKIDISDPMNATILARSEFAIQDKFTNAQGEVLVGFSYEQKQVQIDETDDLFNEIMDDQLVYMDYAQNIIPNSAVPSSFAGNSNASFGTVNRIAKVEDNIYVVSKNNLIILDDNNFANKPLAYEGLKEDMETIFPHNDNLFIGTRTSMDIFDISSPNSPREVFAFDHATSCDPVLPQDEVAYVTLRTGDFAECPGNTNALVVVDVSNLSKAKVKEEIQMNSPYGMAIIGNDLYVGEGKNGLKIFDITNKLSPQLISEDSTIEAYDIIADPTNPSNVFIAGPDGLDQFEILDNKVLDIRSSMSY